MIRCNYCDGTLRSALTGAAVVGRKGRSIRLSIAGADIET